MTASTSPTSNEVRWPYAPLTSFAKLLLRPGLAATTSHLIFSLDTSCALFDKNHRWLTLNTKKGLPISTPQFDPFTPKSEQFQMSPSASPEMLYITSPSMNLTFHSFSDDRWSYYQFSLPHLYISLEKSEKTYFWNLGEFYHTYSSRLCSLPYHNPM